MTIIKTRLFYLLKTVMRIIVRSHKEDAAKNSSLVN